MDAKRCGDQAVANALTPFCNKGMQLWPVLRATGLANEDGINDKNVLGAAKCQSRVAGGWGNLTAHRTKKGCVDTSFSQHREDSKVSYLNVT